MKKIFKRLTSTVLAVTMVMTSLVFTSVATSAAEGDTSGDIAAISEAGRLVFNPSNTEEQDEAFTLVGKYSFSTKSPSIEFEGKTFDKFLKFASAPVMSFKAEVDGKITFIMAANSDECNVYFDEATKVDASVKEKEKDAQAQYYSTKTELSSFTVEVKADTEYKMKQARKEGYLYYAEFIPNAKGGEEPDDPTTVDTTVDTTVEATTITTADTTTEATTTEAPAETGANPVLNFSLWKDEKFDADTFKSQNGGFFTLVGQNDPSVTSSKSVTANLVASYKGLKLDRYTKWESGDFVSFKSDKDGKFIAVLYNINKGVNMKIFEDDVEWKPESGAPATDDLRTINWKEDNTAVFEYPIKAGVQYKIGKGSGSFNRYYIEFIPNTTEEDKEVTGAFKIDFKEADFVANNYSLEEINVSVKDEAGDKEIATDKIENYDSVSGEEGSKVYSTTVELRTKEAIEKVTVIINGVVGYEESEEIKEKTIKLAEFVLNLSENGADTSVNQEITVQ